jgi:hypothetical protein
LKKVIISLFLIFIGVFNYAQTSNNDNIMSHLSISNQYNTLTHAQGNFEWNTGSEYIQHYFFGFDGYSNAFLFRSEYSYNKLSLDIHWTLLFPVKNENKYITFGGGLQRNINSIEDTRLTYDISNGRLTYWKSSFGSSIDIKYGRNNEIHILREPAGDTMPTHLMCYVNVTEEEILTKYLRLYLDGIDYILDKKWETRIKYDFLDRHILEKRYDNDALIAEGLNGRTARELAIFRNYIFARHNYRFRSDEWNIFFKTYYKVNYNGSRTNDEVMNTLTAHEKRVLELVIEQERKL